MGFGITSINNVMSFSKITVEDIRSRKSGQKIVCLTAYSYPIAKILDNHCDIILVGDSVGMAIYGMADTLDVTLDMMINHGKAVTKACKKSFTVIDLPYGSYESDKIQAFDNAQMVMEETGCDAVKIEVSHEILPIAKYLCEKSISLVGHVGLLPQQVRKIGGYKYQATDKESALNIINIARQIDNYGACAIVVEAVPAIVADKITQIVKIPTIGIGASPNCDGQILVIDDLVGLNQEFKPRFVKNYDNVAQKISEAVRNYRDEVILQKFPAQDNLLNSYNSV